MLLSARMLSNVTDVNNWSIVNQIQATAGSNISIYFHLIDASADRSFNPPGRRYIPASNSTLVIGLRSVYPHKMLQYQAIQPFPQDPSMWSFNILPTDGRVAPAPGGGPIIDWSNIVPLGEPFDFNSAITDYGLSGTFGLVMSLNENPGWYGSITLNGVIPGDYVTINGITFLAMASGATGTQFNVGATDALTAANLAIAINSSSGTSQVTAVSNSTTVVVTAVKAASIVWTGTPDLVLSTPAYSPNSVITNGWCPSAISISPSMPMV